MSLHELVMSNIQMVAVTCLCHSESSIGVPSDVARAVPYHMLPRVFKEFTDDIIPTIGNTTSPVSTLPMLSFQTVAIR